MKFGSDLTQHHVGIRIATHFQTLATWLPKTVHVILVEKDTQTCYQDVAQGPLVSQTAGDVEKNTNEETDQCGE